jgi:hypothetical protein
MRRLVYAVAAVLAVAPLAALAPASAAVQRSAAADATCTGGWPQGEVSNANFSNLDDIVGSWHSVDGYIQDDSSTGDTFCRVTDSDGAYSFRAKGTSDCVAYTPSTGFVTEKGCDYSSTNQEWDATGDGYQTVESDLSACLDGTANSDVFMNGCSDAPDNQYWYIP